jgi:hypothetical protein
VTAAPTAHWLRIVIAIPVALVFLMVIGVFTGAVSTRTVERPFFTTTVNATTESLRFMKPPMRDASWTLPPGAISVFGVADSPACVSDGFESSCDVTTNLRLHVTCGAEVAFQTVPDGGWSVTVVGSDNGETRIRVEDANGEEIARSSDYVGYRTRRAEIVRVPFVGEQVQLGEDLRERRTVENNAYDFWQPMLLAGIVQMSADNKPDREKYEVLHESLDRGDVLRVGNMQSASPEAPCKAAADAAGSVEPGARNAADATHDFVWGVLAVTPSTSGEAAPGDPARDTESAGRPAGEQDAFDVVLHTSVNELLVTRFGAPEGHLIKASWWTVVKQRPNFQSAWVAFVSIVLFLTFAIELAGLWGNEHEQ